METKKEKIISAVATIGIILTLFGATYAYFAARTDAGKITDVKITANTVDVLTFETGDPITLNLDQENFASGKGNQSGTTFAKATLSANNKTNTATKHYDLYLIIMPNSFEYSKSSEYPEIILSVKDTNNNELTEINGLDYVTVTDAKGNTVKGFDITMLNGAYSILANKEITAESFNEENWNITVTYVNYDFDQSINAGNLFKMRIIIEEAKDRGVCTSGQTLSSCIISKYGYDENLYYHSRDLVNGEEGNYYAYSRSNFTGIDTYSCTYNGENVINAQTNMTNNSLKGDCDNVYKIDADGSGNNFVYFDSSFDYLILRKESVTWDEENSVCLTNSSKIESTYFFLNLEDMTSDLCTGTAYVLSAYGQTLGVLGFEEVGKGIEKVVNNEFTTENSKFNSYSNGAGDGSYRYAGLDYKLTQKAIDEGFTDILTEDETNDRALIVIYRMAKSKSESYFLYYDANTTEYFSLIEVLSQSINDGYLMINDVNNYVCFGSDSATCPDDNLYRIIGVFEDQVKLIKWDYATSTLLGTDGDYSKDYASQMSSLGWESGTSKGTNDQTAIGAYWWNNDGTENGTNTWSASKLNTVNLNENFLNNIGSKWANKIATTTWKVGGNTLNNIGLATASTAYINEYINPAVNITESKKIGLMYTSDYGFAAAPSAWIYSLLYHYDDDDTIMSNWMYMGLYEWTVVPQSNTNFMALTLSGYGNVITDYVGHSSIAYGVRPVFYLESSINYASGDGTKSSPIRLDYDLK